MEEPRLDTELARIHRHLPYLWEEYGFHVNYFTRDTGMYYRGFIIALENDVCKLVFEKETGSRFDPMIQEIGTKSALFTPPNNSYFAKDGWYSLTGLIYWITGIEYESVRDVDKDLENLSQYLKLHIDKVLDLFRSPDEFDEKLEYYRNFYKDKQITVEKIQEERSRLQALDQDWSLEAAVTSLLGGANEQPGNGSGKLGTIKEKVA